MQETEQRCGCGPRVHSYGLARQSPVHAHFLRHGGNGPYRTSCSVARADR